MSSGNDYARWELIALAERETKESGGLTNASICSDMRLYVLKSLVDKCGRGSPESVDIFFAPME
jgi:hypothetical protein